MNFLLNISRALRSNNAPLFLTCIFISAKTTFFFALLFFPNPIVPDEGGYADTICRLNQNPISIDGLSLYFSWGPAFLLLSQFFNLLSLDCIVALRATNLIFSIITAFIFYKLVSNINNKEKRNINYALINVGFAIFLFFPNKFFWTSIGIREANIEFLVISAIFLIYELKNIVSRKKLISYLLLLYLDLLILSFTRIFLFYCLVFVFAIFLFFTKRYPIKKLLAVVLLGAVVSNPFFPMVSIKIIGMVYEYKLERKITNLEKEIDYAQKRTNEKKVEDENSIKTTTSDRSMALEEKKRQIANLNQDIERAKNIKNTPFAISTNITSPDYSREVRAADARSSVDLKNCTFRTNDVYSRVICNVKYIPTGIATVMLRPNPIYDWYSNTTKIASVENFIYLFLVFFIIFVFFRNRFSREFYQTALIPILFIAFSFLGLALYGGNVGTIFRHRSITLWAISFILILIALEKPRLLRRRE